MFILKRKDGKISNLQFAFMVIFIIIIGYIALKYTYDSLELGRKLFPENDNIKQFTLDIKQKPNEPWNYVYRGHEYMKIAEYNNALNDFNKAIDLNKINNNSIFYDDKVKALLALNKSNDALNTINSAIQYDPDKPHLNFIRAVVYDYQKEYLKSINDYTKFIDEANIKDFPNRITYALQRRAINYYQLDRKNDAITSLEQARKIVIKKEGLDEICASINLFFNNDETGKLLKSIKSGNKLSKEVLIIDIHHFLSIKL